MQLQGPGKQKGTARAVPFSSCPGLVRLSVVAVGRARPASPAGGFAALSSGNARFLTGELVCRSLLVRRASALGRDCALGLWVHRGKAAGRLSTHSALGSRVGSAIVSASARCASASSARSASLVHAIPLVVGLVRHYRSPRRDIRRLSRSRLPDVTIKMVCCRSEVASDGIPDAQASGRKFRARTNRLPFVKIVDFFTSLTCVTRYVSGWESLGADTGWRWASGLRIFGQTRCCSATIAASSPPSRGRQ